MSCEQAIMDILEDSPHIVRALADGEDSYHEHSLEHLNSCDKDACVHLRDLLLVAANARKKSKVD